MHCGGKICGGCNGFPAGGGGGGYRSGNRNFPSCLPPKPVASCCYPVPVSSCCSNPCVPFCYPKDCETTCRPCPRPRISMCCPPLPTCMTPCPIFTCSPAPCCSPTARANADTTYLVPIPPSPPPSVIVRPKISCPNASCQPAGPYCPPPPCPGVEACPKIAFC